MKNFYFEVCDHKDVTLWFSRIAVAGAVECTGLDDLFINLVSCEIEKQTLRDVMIEAIDHIINEVKK